MKRSIFFLTCLIFTATASAQTDPAPPAESVSYFRMFFLTQDLFGQMVITVLMLLSLCMVACLVRLVIANRRAALIPPGLAEEVEGLIAKQRHQEALTAAKKNDSYLARLLRGAIEASPHGYAAMETALGEIADAETARMLRPLEFLNVIGNVAPMIGLFGTVYGMIVSFWKFVESGRPAPSELAAGISAALVATFWGLVVAIPALAGYGLMRNKVDTLTADGLVVAERVIQPFKQKE